MAKFCSNCGNELDEHADVCLKCGKMVNEKKGININLSTGIPEGHKSKLAAILLAFFLGGLGVHNFYLGNTNKAIAQLLLTAIGWIIIISPIIFGWIIIIGPIISGIWAFVEFIMLLTGSISSDASGQELM